MQDKIELSGHFLIMEYNPLQQRANSYEEIKSKRVNFFLVVIAAGGAVLSAILNSKNLSPYIYEFTIIFSLLGLTLGFLTLKMLISYSIAIVVFHRRAARIRRWFVDQNETLQHYVAFEPNDDKPTFTMPKNILYWRGAESILLLINAAFIAILTAVVLLNKTSLLYLVSPPAFVAGVIFWYIQVYYTQFKLRGGRIKVGN